jgi:hypothetical protein
MDFLSTFKEHDMLGIDPPDFFASHALLKSGKLVVARCSCGEVGCGSATVQTLRGKNTFTWFNFSINTGLIKPLVFSRPQYDLAVETAMNDHSWETIERTAERLISELDFSKLKKYKLKFNWASGSLDKEYISITFNFRSRYQVVVKIPWNHKVLNDVITNVITELNKPPKEWSDVTYYPLPLKQNLSSPGIAGPGWRHG